MAADQNEEPRYAGRITNQSQHAARQREKILQRRQIHLSMYRDTDCNSLRKNDIGRQVTLAGWVNVTRDHGGVIFIDLRDREGLTQVVFRPEENATLAKEAHSLRSEDVIEISGRVAARLPGTENPNLATGDVEIIPNELRILNRSEPLPFPLDAEPQNEDL